MTFTVGSMQLNTVREVLHGSANDVYICQDINAANDTYYTLWLIRDNTIAKKFITLFHEAKVKETEYITSFSYQDKFGMVFTYKAERFLKNFYMGSAFSLNVCETICINLVMECISCNMPYPVLYLILTQNQIHMSKDNGIFFSYQLDFDQFDETKKEKDCVIMCAQIVLELLAAHESEKAISYKLLERKIPKEGYRSFTELYKDIRMSAVSANKIGLKGRLMAAFKRNQDRLFRFMLVICTILGVIVLAMLIMQLIYGDVPFMRFLINPFKQIGTESMLQ
ncbi:MAG: hypothetical protein PHE02_14685 [Lachnospiraceae bacterium]|nr:hypothetical protein [Lachnospiraceae bacterium]